MTTRPCIPVRTQPGARATALFALILVAAAWSAVIGQEPRPEDQQPVAMDDCEVLLKGVKVPASTPLEHRHEGMLVAGLRLERNCFPSLYPVCAPGGIPVTRGFPLDPQPGDSDDHPHHRSLWLAHGDINGIDYWSGKGKIRTDRVLWMESQNAHATVAGIHATLLDDEGQPLGLQNAVYVVHADSLPWKIDVFLQIIATDRELRIGDTKEGFFGMRLHDELRPDREPTGDSAARARIRNSVGDAGSQVWGQRARWVCYSGQRDGKTVSVVMMDHPDNLRYPATWHAREYGLLAANPFGLHDFLGEPAETGEIRLAPKNALWQYYRILLASSELDDQEIEQAFSGFAESSHSGENFRQAWFFEGSPSDQP